MGIKTLLIPYFSWQHTIFFLKALRKVRRCRKTDIYALAHEKLSLSRMTFSHQMVRLFFVEQIYRALTILRGEPYHHE